MTEKNDAPKEDEPKASERRMSREERDLHARMGLTNPFTGERETLYPGDPGYDNIPPTAAQEEHYQEQGMSAKELREKRATEKRADETLRKTIAQTTGGDKE